MEEFQKASKETIKRIREIERKTLNKMYPDRKPIVPSGPECSFCFKAENEVKAMAKHKSGFNICNECIQSIQSSEEE